jgi:hypothetical protein
MNQILIYCCCSRPPLRSSSQSFWLLTQRSRVRFPALPDFLSSSFTSRPTSLLASVVVSVLFLCLFVVYLKNAVVWDIMPCCYYKNISFARTYRLHHQVEKIKELQLILPAYIVPSSMFLCALVMEAIRPSESSVLTRATQCHILENDILPSHRRENLKSYIALTGWAL